MEKPATPTKTVLVFGNQLVQKDSLALLLLPKLRKALPKVEFVELDGTEELDDYGQDLTILDAAVGIDKVTIITDLDCLELPRVCSMHDFDLAWNLKLLQKVGRIKTARIIAIPTKMREKEALGQVVKLLATST